MYLFRAPSPGATSKWIAALGHNGRLLDRDLMLTLTLPLPLPAGFYGNVLKMGWARARIEDSPEWLWRYFILTDSVLCLSPQAPVRFYFGPRVTDRETQKTNVTHSRTVLGAVVAPAVKRRRAQHAHEVLFVRNRRSCLPTQLARCASPGPAAHVYSEHGPGHVLLPCWYGRAGAASHLRLRSLTWGVFCAVTRGGVSEKRGDMKDWYRTIGQLSRAAVRLQGVRDVCLGRAPLLGEELTQNRLWPCVGAERIRSAGVCVLGHPGRLRRPAASPAKLWRACPLAQRGGCLSEVLWASHPS